MESTESKSWWKSKSIWQGIIGVLAGTAVEVADTGVPKGAGVGMVAWSVLQIILRRVTTTPIK